MTSAKYLLCRMPLACLITFKTNQITGNLTHNVTELRISEQQNQKERTDIYSHHLKLQKFSHGRWNAKLLHLYVSVPSQGYHYNLCQVCVPKQTKSLFIEDESFDIQAIYKIVAEKEARHVHLIQYKKYLIQMLF